MTRLIPFFAITIVLFGCSTKQESVETNTKAVTNIGVDAPSELTVLMRTMEAKMQGIKKNIKEHEKIDSTNFNDYQAIFTIPASKHVSRDSAFLHLGDDFLTQFDDLTKNIAVDSINSQYNTVINSCISCHTVYCPGPVTRIKKLLL